MMFTFSGCDAESKNRILKLIHSEGAYSSLIEATDILTP